MCLDCPRNRCDRGVRMLPRKLSTGSRGIACASRGRLLLVGLVADRVRREPRQLGVEHHGERPTCADHEPRPRSRSSARWTRRAVPGTAKGATANGVTNTSITIGYGDDAGYAAAPGLDKEMSDAVKPMIAVVQPAGRHQRPQDHRQLLRREGAAGHAGDDPGVQRQGLHARRPGLRARRRPGADPHRVQALDDPGLRGRHRVRERLGHAAADPEPRRPGDRRRPRSRSRSCSPTR